MSAPSQFQVSPVVKRSFPKLKSIYLLGSSVLIPASLFLWLPSAQAQNPDGFIEVDSIDATLPGGTVLQTLIRGYATTCDTGSFTACDTPGAVVDITFGDGGNRVLQGGQGLDDSGTRYTFTRSPIANEVLIFRRSSADLRENIFFETTSIGPGAPPTTLNLSPEPATGLETALLSFIINRGVDNVFDNVGKGGAQDNQNTLNNIERIDYILPSGIADDPTDAEARGFYVLERGGNDRFFIAAITSIDPATNTPTGYGPLRLFDVGDWVTSAPAITIETSVLDRTSPAAPALASHTVGPQPVEGVIFPINSLLEPVDAGTTVFGYSLFAGDTPPGSTSAQLTNIADTTTFPRDTFDTSPEGGLDLIASGFGILTTQAQAFAFTLTPDTNLSTQIGVPVDHPFTVTNTGTSTDTITLTTDGTDPNYTVQIIDPATGNPVTDTGPLTSGESVNYILRVTPNAGAPLVDTTIVRGTNSVGDFQEVTKTTNLASFTMTPDTQLPGVIGQPTIHPFTVTNDGTTPDTINLVPEGTDPNYTVEIIDTTTGNVVTDTGVLQPGETVNLALRVTPGPNATTNDTTIVRGTSANNGTSLTVEKITTLQAGTFTITPPGDLTTVIGEPVDHPFTVTNISPNPDTITLTPVGTDPNYTAQIIDPGTNQPVTSTGVLQPGTSVNYVLRVTPGPNANTNDTTIVRGTNTNNETQEVTKITRLSNFNLTTSGQLPGTIGEPVDHPFTLTNTGNIPDTFTLLTEGTTPGYTVQLIDPATNQPVVDSVPLQPGETTNLILRVTPGPNATGPDNTVIRATSTDNGATQTITRTTTLADDGTGNITLTKRITRVFRTNAGQVETYSTLVPTTLPPGFVGVTSPTPAELQSGDLVEYTIYFNNDTSGRVTNLEICDPIPTESEFVGDPTFVPEFQDRYSSGQSIAYDGPSVLPLGDGTALSNVFDGDEGEYVNPLTPRASCPGESSGNQGAVVVRIGAVAPGEAGFIKFTTRLR